MARSSVVRTNLSRSRLSEEHATSDSYYKRDFIASFPPPVDEEAVVKTIVDYVKTAQALVDLLENLFPSADEIP